MPLLPGLAAIAGASARPRRVPPVSARALECGRSTPAGRLEQPMRTDASAAAATLDQGPLPRQAVPAIVPPGDMRLPACIVLAAALAGCGMFAVKEQQQKIDAACRIDGRIDAERKADAPLIVPLLPHAGDQWPL